MEVKIRVVNLIEAELENVVYRIQKRDILQFRLSSPLHGHGIILFTNHPLSKNGVTFERTSFQRVEWVVDKENEETYANVTAVLSGCFQFYFHKDGVRSGSGYFLVDPELTTGSKDETLPLDAVCCQTFFPKSLGPFKEWKGRLEVAYQTGYNMIHFTPVQQLGDSNSSYSIANQLSLNKMFGDVTFEDVKQLVDDMKKDWGVLSICDVVFNHTANETPWLRTNPECGYNLVNSPHLRPAYLLDYVLTKFSLDIANNAYADRGLPSKITSEEHLNIIKAILKNELLPKMKIEELFLVNVEEMVEKFRTLIICSTSPVTSQAKDLDIVQDPEYRRLKSTVDMDLATQIHHWQKFGGSNAAGAIESFRSHLNWLNENMANGIQIHLHHAVENVLSGVRYERLQHDGPKLPEVTVKDPLIHRYFEEIGFPVCKTLEEAEELVHSDNSKYILAHNGWVMNDDPLKNFAEAGSNVYLRREVIAWDDSVKLRFGEDRSTCPFLWDIMKEYVETTAKVFHGLRLDNCHSTPIHLAEYLLDAARKVRSDLYVVAELFTNSDKTDNIFVNRLGVTSLIREAMSAADSHEEGRLVHRYGGLPVGAFADEPVQPLMSTIAHALLMDQTHDNPSPIDKRSVYDVLPTAALVSMANCATGSNRGLDELVPHHIHVVHESRLYSSWSNDSIDKAGIVNTSCGILAAKRVINDLHTKLAKEGFTEVFVDQMEHDIVAVTRHHPLTHVRIVLVAYTAFAYPDPHFHRSGGVKDVQFEGVLENVLFECQLKPKEGSKGSFFRPVGFQKDEAYLNALKDFECTVASDFPITNSQFVKLEGNAIKFVNFQPGSVIAFRISAPAALTNAVSSLRTLISKESLMTSLSSATLSDLNFILYKCEEEEKDFSGCGTYNIPQIGNTVYAGLQGIQSILGDVRLRNDTGHPLCNNVRDGDWLMEYTYFRLLRCKGTSALGSLIQNCAEHIRHLPRFLVPRYFDIVFKNAYMACIESSWSQMSRFVQESSPFVKSLALGSVQCCGLSVSGPLPFLSPKMRDPKPSVIKINEKDVQDCGSLCAGLTHFSTGYMRNWGRDTFISLPGLLISTGRYDDARYHILAYASVLRHGLIPNLLDRGTNSRYNCRDATWFWLQAIKIYVTAVPNGDCILQDCVSRMWPGDCENPVLDHSIEQSLQDVMQESLQRHFEGINFRERNAGNRIDAHMRDDGFNVVAGVDLKTGFIVGGNQWNCGTWMDKMGSSETAGNKGTPATPRDGSAIELVGLSASVLNFLSEMHAAGKYKYASVQRGSIIWTWSEWHNKICQTFEEKFWIAESSEGKLDPHEEFIHRRGIYKDSFGATVRYCDYQLRPNFLIAMAVAPQLFTPSRAMTALENCKAILLSKYGMRTLDPSDWNYNGNYDNSNDSSDKKLAHGFNYHNGPEWLWPVGFYLRAVLHFFTILGKQEDAVKHVKQVMSHHWQYLQSSPWKGLPELTNKDGAECWGSCRVQAWSMATLLEVLQDLHLLKQ